MSEDYGSLKSFGPSESSSSSSIPLVPCPGVCYWGIIITNGVPEIHLLISACEEEGCDCVPPNTETLGDGQYVYQGYCYYNQ